MKAYSNSGLNFLHPLHFPPSFNWNEDMMAGAPAAVLDNETTLRTMSPTKDAGEERQEKPGPECLWDHCDNPGLPSTRFFF